MQYTVCKSLEIAGSHKLSLNYDSPCQRLHGHNWHIKVYFRSDRLDANGMVIDFKAIKKYIHDRFDHQYINEVLQRELRRDDFNPTAENMAAYFIALLPVDKKRNCYCYRVEVQESDGNIASAEVGSLEERIGLKEVMFGGTRG